MTEFIEKKNDEYLEFVRGKPCMFCGKPAVPHHYGTLAQGNGMGTKCDDTYTVPLCDKHHRMLHDGRLGSKADLFKKFEAVKDRYVRMFNQRKEM